MRHFFAYLFALFVVGGLLAGCGGSGHEATPVPTLAQTTEVTAVALPATSTATARPTVAKRPTKPPATPTATALITPVLLPSPTATSPSRPQAQVVVDELQGFNTPGGTLIGIAPRGQKLTITGRDTSGTWLQFCCFDNRIGWAPADGVKLLTGDLNTVPTVVVQLPPTPSSAQSSPLQTPAAGPAQTSTPESIAPTPVGTQHQWAVLAPSSVGPAPRQSSVFVYDPVDDQLLLFGGKGQPGFLNDLWRYKLTTKKWERISVEGGPSPRSGANGFWDPVRKQLLLVGGVDVAGYHSDVWAYNPAKNSWQRLSPDDKSRNRAYAIAVYDPVHDALFWFGGQNVDGALSDTWTYQINGGSWKQSPPGVVNPAARYHAAAAYDVPSQQIVLFGGCSTAPGSCPRDDVWAYDVIDQMWQQYVPQTTRPQARQKMAYAFDAQNNTMLIYGGGGTDGQELGDLWSFRAISGLWTLLAAENSPGRRYGAVATFVNNPPRFVLFGGVQGAAYLSDLWSLDVATK